ncbi:hypothetical protein JRO89_XS01G0014100 [Xanthoceras sorbifolium]|uniref:glycine--tRNA ligase n=1 Tax=Xanthoceras sorbifolium TaxID=99658 RepID=A0ABQ8IHQ0_9ROSI|nr:hypothetical protein JRO89_XS01G0014100 [Xanthoceras sorbifolium]
MSAYYLEHASVDHVQKHFDFFEEEARSLLASGLPIPAYDQLLKTSHAFNILDSRGFVGVTERAWVGCAGVVSEPVNLIYPKELLEAATEKVYLAYLVHDDPRLFVLELGTEEMPPQDVVNSSQQVCVENLCKKQTANEVEVRGPPVSKAFDQQGNPTKAAEGFCRRYDVPLDSLFMKVDGESVKIHARILMFFLLILFCLRMCLVSLLRYHSQSQCAGTPRYVQYLFVFNLNYVALSGVGSCFCTFEELELSILPCYYNVCNVQQTNSLDYGPPWRCGCSIYVCRNLEAQWLKNGNLSYGLCNTPSATVLDGKKTILECSNALAKSVNGNVVVRESLLNEVVNLVMAPVPILGMFKESFLELPEDLLTMVIQKHHKYFVVTDDKGEVVAILYCCKMSCSRDLLDSCDDSDDSIREVKEVTVVSSFELGLVSMANAHSEPHEHEEPRGSYPVIEIELTYVELQMSGKFSIPNPNEAKRRAMERKAKGKKWRCLASFQSLIQIKPRGEQWRIKVLESSTKKCLLETSTEGAEVNDDLISLSLPPDASAFSDFSSISGQVERLLLLKYAARFSEIGATKAVEWCFAYSIATKVRDLRSSNSKLRTDVDLLHAEANLMKQFKEGKASTWDPEAKIEA